MTQNLLVDVKDIKKDITEASEKIVKLEKKLDRLENNLNKTKEKLYKIKPQRPLTHDYQKYDNKKKELITSYEYYCPWCGEALCKPKTKAVSRHKCGQMIDWKFQIVNDLESGNEINRK